MNSLLGLFMCLVAVIVGISIGEHDKIHKSLDSKVSPIYRNNLDEATAEALAVARVRERAREAKEYKAIGDALDIAESARAAEEVEIAEAHEREIRAREIRETTFKTAIEDAFQVRTQTDNQTQELYDRQINLESSKKEDAFRRDVSEAMQKSQFEKYLNLGASNLKK